MKRPEDMGGEELRREAKRADEKLGLQIELIRRMDPAFRAVLDRALELESEIERRKNR